MAQENERRVNLDSCDGRINVMIDNSKAAAAATARLVMQPMLGLTLFMCKTCTEQSTSGSIVKVETDRNGLLLVLCDYCLEWNAKLRAGHISDIILKTQR